MPDAEGPLAGLRVVELASDHAAFAGKLFADLGAEVILVEPPGGHRSRGYGPFVDDNPDPALKKTSVPMGVKSPAKSGIGAIDRVPPTVPSLVQSSEPATK